MEKRERKEQLKQRLRRYTSLKAERQQLLAQYNALTDPRGASLDGMPKGPGAGDPLAGIATKRQALANRYLAKLEEMAAEQSAIEDMIEGLEPTARLILRHKYIEGLTWEEVCVAVNYSWRQTHNLHDQALEALLAAEVEKEEMKEEPKQETVEDFDPCDGCCYTQCHGCRHADD